MLNRTVNQPAATGGVAVLYGEDQTSGRSTALLDSMKEAARLCSSNSIVKSSKGKLTTPLTLQGFVSNSADPDDCVARQHGIDTNPMFVEAIADIIQYKRNITQTQIAFWRIQIDGQTWK